MTTTKAKKIIKSKLNEWGLDYKLTAKTISFADLARGSSIFVTVHGWKPNEKWNELEKLARDNNFRVTTIGNI